MLMLGLSFTSCSDDDGPGVPSTESINELLEGEWFLVEESDNEGGKIIWDYENQLENGIANDEEYDSYHKMPHMLTISKNNSGSFYFFYSYYNTNSNYWRKEKSFNVDLDSNIIEEGVDEENHDYTYKDFIASISESTLVIVSEVKYSDGDYEKVVYSYRRNK